MNRAEFRPINPHLCRRARHPRGTRAPFSPPKKGGEKEEEKKKERKRREEKRKKEGEKMKKEKKKIAGRNI